MVVGSQMIEEYDLKIDNGQTKYNPEQDPSVSNEFATVSSFAIDKCHSRIRTLKATDYFYYLKSESQVAKDKHCKNLFPYLKDKTL